MPGLGYQDGVSVVLEDVVSGNTVLDDLYYMALQHLRVDDGGSPQLEEAEIRRCVAGAVEAAENYLQKDVVPREYVLDWHRGRSLQILSGNVSDLAVTVGGGSPPTSILSQLDVRGSPYFRGGGLRLYGSEGYHNPPRRVTFVSGFSAGADIPGGVLSFTLAATGMLYEVREIANVGGQRYSVIEFPTYLLDPYKTEVIA